MKSEGVHKEIATLSHGQGATGAWQGDWEPACPLLATLGTAWVWRKGPISNSRRLYGPTSRLWFTQEKQSMTAHVFRSIYNTFKEFMQGKRDKR